jgi:tRNA (cytidine/uridine-2'-O-)-methyltransferase
MDNALLLPSKNRYCGLLGFIIACVSMDTENKNAPISLTLYQSDIPQNVGAAMRLCACLGIKLNLIEPFGFLWKEREFKRSAMDYIDLVDVERHMSWGKFRDGHKGRIILMTTKAAVPYTEFEFQDGDTLMAGRESAGVPDDVHDAVDARIYIPMHGQARSMNVINASSMIMGEALRQVS